MSKLRFSMVLMAVVLGGMALPFTSTVRADAPGPMPLKIGICNPLKIARECKEFQDMKDAATKRQTDFNSQVDDKKKQAADLQTQLSLLDPSTDAYKAKNEELLKFSIETDVWAKMTEASEQRLQKANTKALFDKIDAAIAQVAQDKQFTLIITDQSQQLPADLDTIDINTLNQVLVSRSILFHEPSMDITGDVEDALNKAYAGGH